MRIKNLCREFLPVARRTAATDDSEMSFYCALFAVLCRYKSFDKPLSLLTQLTCRKHIQLLEIKSLL